LVFVTKDRRGVLDADMSRACEDAMRKVCGDVGTELRDFNGEDDHGHLLSGYPPKVAVPALVNRLNGVPARRLRPHGHFWSPSYLAASRGGVPPTSPPPAAACRRAPSGTTSTSKQPPSAQLPG